MKRLIAPMALVTALAALLVLSAAALGHGQSRGGLKKATIMKGRNEVPPADPDGLGHALIRLKPATSQVCWRLWARRIAPATASHIHRGPRGVNGPIVVPLTPPTTGRSAGCVAADPALIDEIRLHPGRFYVNVHNADFPGGAIRGQLHGLTGHQ